MADPRRVPLINVTGVPATDQDSMSVAAFIAANAAGTLDPLASVPLLAIQGLPAGDPNSISVDELIALAGVGTSTDQRRMPINRTAPVPAGDPNGSSLLALLTGGGLPRVDVIIVAGQSNAAGYSSDASSLVYTADPQVKAWNGSAFVTYQPNTGVCGFEGNLGQNIGPSGRWAAEMQYSRLFRAANPSKELRVIKYTAGGTYLFQSPDGATTQDWNPASSGELFAGAKAFINAALAAIVTEGKTPNIRMLWWAQGEYDAQDPTRAAAYQANLTTLIAQMRAQWGVPTATKIVLGRLANSSTWPYRLAVRLAEYNVANADPYVFLQNTDTYASDGTHYTMAGLIAAGADLWAFDSGSIAEPDQTTPLALAGGGSVAWNTTSPKFGQSLIGGYAQVSGQAVPLSGDFTVEAWGKNTLLSSNPQILFGQSSYFWMGMVNGYATFAVGPMAGVQTSILINDGNYHHFELNASISNNTAKFFVDGNLAYTASGYPVLDPTTYPLGIRCLGGAPGSYDYYGDVDEVAIWAGIRHTANFAPPTAPYIGNEPNLIGLWHLDGNGNSGLV